MGVFTAYVQAKLDPSSIKSIESDINKATKGIKAQIGVDANYIQNEISNALSGMNINASKLKITGNTQIPSQIQKELDKQKFTIKIDKVDIAGNIANLGKNVTNGLSQSIEEQLNNGKIDSAIAKTRDKLQNALKDAMSTKGSDLNQNLFDFNAQDTEIRGLIDRLNMYKSNMQNALQMGDADYLTQAWSAYSKTLEECNNKLQLLSSSGKTFASSIDISNLNSKMRTWLDSNAESSDHLKQSVTGLVKQLDGLKMNNATGIEMSQLKAIESEFNRITNVSKILTGTANKIRVDVETGTAEAKLTALETKLSKYESTTAEYANASTAIKEMAVAWEEVVNAEKEFSQDHTNIDKQNAMTEAANRYEEASKKANSAMKVLQTTQSMLLTDAQKSSTQKNFEQWCERNSKATKKYSENIKQLENELKNMKTVQDKQDFTTHMNEFESMVRKNGDMGKGFLSSFTTMGSQVAKVAASYLSLHKAISMVKQGVTIVKELDTALVDLRKTTTMSAGELKKFYFDANEVAKEYGSTTKEIIQSAAEWSRLGYSDKNSATQMAQFSSQFATISPGMNIESATESLTSIMKAYDVEVKDVKTIMSKINEIGKMIA